LFQTGVKVKKAHSLYISSRPVPHLGEGAI